MGLTLFHCHRKLHMDFGFMALFNTRDSHDDAPPGHFETALRAEVLARAADFSTRPPLNV